MWTNIILRESSVNKKTRNFTAVNHEVFTGLPKKLPKSRQNGELPIDTILSGSYARMKPPLIILYL